jgi:hypothetical protein
LRNLALYFRHLLTVHKFISSAASAQGRFSTYIPYTLGGKGEITSGPELANDRRATALTLTADGTRDAAMPARIGINQRT